MTELRDGLRAGARSWVGVVRLDGVEIRIVPKLAGDQLGLVKLLELVTGLDGLSRLSVSAVIDGNRADSEHGIRGMGMPVPQIA